MVTLCLRNYRNCKRLQSQAAFTLLEVMIAIAILAIAMTMLLGAQSQSLNLVTESQFNTQASLLSGLKIAKIEAGAEGLNGSEGEFGDNFSGYRWKAEVNSPSISTTPFLADIAEGMIMVDLTITWGEGRFVYTSKHYLYEGVTP